MSERTEGLNRRDFLRLTGLGGAVGGVALGGGIIGRVTATHGGDSFARFTDEFWDLHEVATPANPDDGVRRVFVDQATREISVRTAGGSTVSLEAAAAGGGDNITVNGSAVVDADFDDALPAAPAGGVNVKWQADAMSPANISAHLAAGDVSNTVLADMAANTVKVRAAATLGDPSNLAVPVNTLLGRQAGNIVAAIAIKAQLPTEVAYEDEANLFTLSQRVERTLIGDDAYRTRITGDTQDQLVIRADGRISWGPGGVTAPDTTLFREGADVLRTSDQFRSGRALVGDISFAALVNGDAFLRLRMFADGRMEWGSGAAAADTNLFRGGANRLETDDALRVGEDYEWESGTAFLGTLAHANTVNRIYTFPDVAGNVVLDASDVAITGNWDVTGITGRVKVQTGSGAPAHTEVEGTVYWDTLNDILYVNDAGAATWTQVGPGGGAAHTLDSATHTDVGAMTEAKGDLLVRDATEWTKLAVGTNGQQLEADSAEATGLKWAAAGGGGDILPHPMMFMGA